MTISESNTSEGDEGGVSTYYTFNSDCWILYRIVGPKDTETVLTTRKTKTYRIPRSKQTQTPLDTIHSPSNPTHRNRHGDEPRHGREKDDLAREQKHARAEGGDGAA